MNINTPSNDSIYSPINSIIMSYTSYDDFGDAVSIESFDFNTPSYDIYPLSTSYDSDSIIAILDDRISLLSDYENEEIISSKIDITRISNISNKSMQMELNNFTENNKEETIKKNTFLNNKAYQIEFNKLILNSYKLTFIDKIILTFI
jgi:hypothetical protein